MNELAPPRQAAPGDGLPGPDQRDLLSRPPYFAGGSPNRGFTITLLVSLGLHLAAVTAVLLFLHTSAPTKDGPEKPIQVELVMEEHKGDARPQASPRPPSVARPEPRQAARSAPPSVRPPVQPQPEGSRANIEPASEVPPPPRPEAPDQQAPTAPASDSSPSAAQPGVTVSLRGTDSPSNARAWGNRIMPAAPDAVFHNRPPAYPQEAAMNGEQGTVIVLIHVSPEGTTSGVDLVSSSGYALLDRSVREAVMRWRFLPAVKDGQPVASDMRMGFIFENK